MLWAQEAALEASGLWALCLRIWCGENMKKSKGSRNSGKMFRFLFVILFAVIICSIRLSAFVSSNIEGVVVDKDTGKPIEGARVVLKAVDSTFYPLFSWETKTDKKGYFKFEIKFHLKHLKEYLQVEKKGYISYIPYVYLRYCKRDKRGKIHKLFKIKEGEIKHIKIGLEKGGTVKGRLKIKDDKDERALSDFGFYMVRERNPAPEFLSKEKYYFIKYIKTNKEGYFEASGIEPYDDYLFILNINGYLTKYIENINIKKNQVCEINKTLDLSDQTGVKGEVFFNNNSIRDLTVILWYLEDGVKRSSRILCIYKNHKNGKYFCKGLKAGLYKMKIIAGINDTKRTIIGKDFMIKVVKGETRKFNINLTIKDIKNEK